jgi:hypothetical protein
MATIHVEKAGQKAIVVGHQGNAIKQIGSEARARIEDLLEKKVYLELFVRVTERWKDMPRQLTELGYESSGGGALSHLLPAEPRRRSRKPAPKKPNPRGASGRDGKPGPSGSRGTKPHKPFGASSKRNKSKGARK